MKVFRYSIYIYLCLFAFIGCNRFDTDNQKPSNNTAEFGTLLDSIQIALENWDEEYLHDKLLADPTISDISVNGDPEQRYQLAFALGQYYLNMGLYETAIEKLLPVSKEIETIDTPTKYQIYTLLERCYSYNSDIGNRASVLTNLSSKIDNEALGDSVMAWVEYMFASYYDSIDSVTQRTYHLNKANKFIEKWNIHDLRLMSSLLPYIRANPKSREDKLEVLDSIKKLEPLVDQVSPFYQNIYFSNLGDAYWGLKDYPKTLEITEKEVQSAFAIKNKFKRNKALGSSLINLADGYMNIKDYETALKQLDRADPFIPYTRYRTRIPYYWNRISIFDKLGYPIDSTQKVFYQMARESKDLLQNKSIREIEALNEIKLAEYALIREKNLLLRQKLILQRNLVISSAILVALCLIFLLFFQRFRMKAQKQETEILKMRNKLLVGQLNPHFLHNSIYSIMLSVEEKVPTAYEYLGRLSKMLRHVFSYYQSDEVPLEEELKLLENYFFLEQSKLQNKQLLTLNIEVDPEIDPKNTLIIPLVMQALLENAVKYRIHNEVNTIELKLTKGVSNELECILSDTGKGVKSQIIDFDPKHSLYYIERFVDSLSNQSSLVIAPRKDTRGTIAKLILPYKLKDDD